MVLSGGCQCGAVRYEITAAPEVVYCCHCTECQAQSASAFGISVIVPDTAMRVTEGTPGVWVRATDMGNRMSCWFCSDCGSRLWHQLDADPANRSVKGGSLDQPPDLTTASHIHVRRKLAGVILPPCADVHEAEPPWL